MERSPELWLLVLFLVFVQPLLGSWRMRRLRRLPQPLPSPSKLRVYLWVVLSQWTLVGLTAWILARQERSLLDMGLDVLGDPWIAWVAVAVGIGMAASTVRGVRALAARPEAKLPSHLRNVLPILPSTGSERAAFLVVALTAGFCEEVLYRGLLIGFLTSVLGSSALALAAGAVVFGTAHAYQGPRGMLITGVLGAILGLIYLYGGSLWPCIWIHATLDMASGFALGAQRWQDRTRPSSIERDAIPGGGRNHEDGPDSVAIPRNTEEGGMARATFAAGCFWGVEAAFRRVKGVTATTVGYAGGTLAHPTYEDVCSDRTGHAEVVQVEYDPEQVSYEDLLRVFWENHDPTQKNRQGPDVGSQYRSGIFFHSPEQEAAARASKQELEGSGRYSRPIATEIVPAGTFWPAEDYHQQYLEKRGLAHCDIPKS